MNRQERIPAQRKLWHMRKYDRFAHRGDPQKKSFYFIIEGVRNGTLRRRVCWLSARCFSVWSRTLGVSAHNASVLDASRHDASLLDVSPIGVSALDVSRPSMQRRQRRATTKPDAECWPFSVSRRCYVSAAFPATTSCDVARWPLARCRPLAVGRWPGVARWLLLAVGPGSRPRRWRSR